MNTFKELKEAFLRHVEKLFTLLRGKHGSDFDETLVSQGESDEERETLRAVLEEVELEHQIKKEMRESGKEPGQWFEEELEKTAHIVLDNPTDDDIRMLKEKMAEVMAEDIAEGAELLSKEVTEAEAGERDTASDDGSEQEKEVSHE